MSYVANSVAAVVGPLVMAIVVIRHISFFAVLQGTSDHLWFAIIAAVIACSAGSLVFYFIRRLESHQWSKVPARPGAALAATIIYPIANTPAEAPLAAMNWAQLKPWLSEGQADDRRPVPGTDGDNIGSSSARRSSARRTHQVMYKKWSQARHD